MAYWRPDHPCPPPSPHPIEYRITWPDDVKQVKGFARLCVRRVGWTHKQHQILTVDYDDSSGLTADKITPEVGLSSGKLISAVADNPETHGWRVVIPV